MIFLKRCRVGTILFLFVFFHRDCINTFCCLFSQRFSAAYLLKLFLLPQRVHTTLLIRFDEPDLSLWCSCSLHAGIQMSPVEMVCSRDSCRHSVAEGTVDVPIGLFRQIFSARTALFSRPFSWSAAYIWSPFDFCKPFRYRNDPCNCHHFSPYMSPGDALAFKYFSTNALPLFCRTRKSAVRMPYAGWFILSFRSDIARTHNLKTFWSSMQMVCCKIFTILWYDTSYRCLCDHCVYYPLCHHLCAIFHIVAWVCLFVLKHTCKLLSMLLHLILHCPSQYCIPPLLLNVEWWCW